SRNWRARKSRSRKLIYKTNFRHSGRLAAAAVPSTPSEDRRMASVYEKLRRLASLPDDAYRAHALSELLPALVVEFEALHEELADWKAIAQAAQRQLDVMAGRPVEAEPPDDEPPGDVP